MRHTSVYFLAFPLGLCGVASAQSHGSYDPVQGTTPDAQGWTRAEFNGTSTAAAISGELHHGPTGVSEGLYWTRSDLNFDLASPEGFRVQVDLKIDDADYLPSIQATGYWRMGFELLLSDMDQRVVRLGVATEGVRVESGVDDGSATPIPLIPLDTTSGFRRYDLEVRSSVVTLRVDGAQIVTLPLGMPNGTDPGEVYFGDATQWAGGEFRIRRVSWSPAGVDWTPYCGPSVMNSTGLRGQITVEGSASVGTNDLDLVASSLPPLATTLFIVSADVGYFPMAGGSRGNLCLGGTIGRFRRPGEISTTGAAGRTTLSVDLTRLPVSLNPIVVQPGSTWFFQAWHRDLDPMPTSNFTDGVEVVFSP